MWLFYSPKTGNSKAEKIGSVNAALVMTSSFLIPILCLIQLCMIPSVEGQVAYDNCEVLQFGMKVSWKYETAAQGIYFEVTADNSETGMGLVFF